MSEPPHVRRIDVIENPISGLRSRHDLIPEFLDRLRSLGIELSVTRTEGQGHATEIAREAERRERDAVVVIGGDGTVNEALNGLNGGRTALGTFPLGTSSILARDLKVPFDPRRAAEVVRAGRRRRLDVGVVNGRRFLMVVGVGWDAHVVKTVAALREGHLGQHRYLLPVLRAAWEYGWPRLRVAVDGGPAREAHLAFACNIRNYAAFFRIAPRADPGDGRLDFVGDGRPRNYLRWALAAFTGTLPRYREVEYVQGREIEVRADEPVPFQVDGDPGGTTPIRITLEPGALEVIVP